jgi:hypothetical protein
MRFAERHAWKLFLAWGLLSIWFGASDLSSAVTFVSRQLALSILVIAVLQIAVASTALRSGHRWAWLVMWLWPLYGVVDSVNLATEPTRGLAYAAFDASVAAVMAVTLLLSSRRYLRRL